MPACNATSHPYDPFKHEDYYKFMAFFNDTRDEDTEADYPLLREYKTDDSIKVLQVINWLRQNASDEEAKRSLYIFKNMAACYTILYVQIVLPTVNSAIPNGSSSAIMQLPV